jgi:regulatory protein
VKNVEGEATTPPQSLYADLPPGARRQLKRAIAALARREHGRVELERKLTRRLTQEDSPADITAALDRLQQRGMLSDTRMVQSLVRSRAQRYGRRRLEQELQQRGVDAATIEQSLPTESQDAATATALWQRKFGSLPTTPAERARQGRYLMARGFSGALVARILGGRDVDVEVPAAAD